jgi:hypothetical protein
MASVMTSHPAGGPDVTATSSVSRRPSLAFASLSPEPARFGGNAGAAAGVNRERADAGDDHARGFLAENPDWRDFRAEWAE